MLNSIRKKAAALCGREYVPAPAAPDVVAAVLGRLVAEDAHPDTLLAIATADAIVLGGQQCLGNVVIRLIVCDRDGDIRLAPLPNVRHELDIVLVRQGVSASVDVSNSGDAVLRQEFLVEGSAHLLLRMVSSPSSRCSRQTTLLGQNASLIEREVLRNASCNVGNVVVHAAPCTKSDVKQYGTAAGEVVSHALVRVLRHSSNVTASISQHWLLLDGVVKARPALEVEEDDIAVSHSESISPIDEEALFFAQSRGVPLQDAKQMVIECFLDQAGEIS